MTDEPVPLAITLPGGPLRMFVHRNDEFISPHIRDTGTWEPAETRLFAGRLRPGDHVIDVGANIGYYSLIASRLVGAGGLVIAIEPDAANCAFLRRNLTENSAGNVWVVEAAASDRPGVERLYPATSNLGDHRTYDPGDGRTPGEVIGVRIDDLVGEGQPVHFMKIDAQGAELRILRGARETIGRNAGHITIVLEFWPAGLEAAGASAADLLRELRRYPLEAAIIDEAAGVARPVSEHDLLDLAEGNLHPSTGFFTNVVLARGLHHELGSAG